MKQTADWKLENNDKRYKYHFDQILKNKLI